MQAAGVVPALNDAVTPLGNPEALAVTVLAKPLSGVKVSVLLPLAPCAMLSAVGEAAIVKLGGFVIVTAIVVFAVNAPDVPVIVTVVVPAAAVDAAVKVIPRGEPLAEPNVAVTPAGSPEAASATVPVKPFCALMAMLLTPLAPPAKLTLAGVAESVNVAGAVMVSAMLAFAVNAPDVPVTVTVEIPAVAPAPALIVTVLACVELAGLNVAVTPVGRPLAEKLTVPLKVPRGVTVMALAPLPPAVMPMLAGDAAIAKPLAALTVTLIVAVLRKLPDVPAIVIVEVPSAAELVAVSVRALAPAALVAPNDALTPAGKPDALSVTVPLKPFCAALVMLLVILLP
jgi:hypothetical protein